MSLIMTTKQQLRHGQGLGTVKRSYYLSDFCISRGMAFCDRGSGILVNKNVLSLSKCIYKQCIGFGPLISLKEYYEMHFTHLSFLLTDMCSCNGLRL